MDNAFVLASFRQFTPEAIRDALTHCRANVAEADPFCRAILRGYADSPDPLAEEAARQELSGALLYLAYRRDLQAFPDLLRLIAQPAFAKPLTETDWLLRNLHRFLAAILAPDQAMVISDLILNRDLTTEVREQALLAYPFLLQEGVLEEKQLTDEYRRLLTVAMERNAPNRQKQPDNPQLWMATAINAAVIGGPRLRTTLNAVLESGLLQDQTSFVRKILANLFQAGTQNFREVFRKEHRGYFTDLDAEVDGLFAPPETLPDELPGRGHPTTREQPKIGRNDPCPCGSGKKFKKCCGA